MMNGRPALVIDCAEIGKAKNDAGLISALAEQTGMLDVLAVGILEGAADAFRLLPRLFVPVVY